MYISSLNEIKTKELINQKRQSKEKKKRVFFLLQEAITMTAAKIHLCRALLPARSFAVNPVCLVSCRVCFCSFALRSG